MAPTSGHNPANGSSACTSTGNCALNIVLSFHCDTVAQTLTQQFISLFPPGTQKTIEKTCQAATIHNTSATVSPPSATASSYLLGLFG